MASLFISYSRKDIQFAHKLTKSFEGQELDFWIDWEGIPPSVDWWREIEKGIEEADVFVFLLSPDSIGSEICRQEITYAVQNGKRLVPIVVRDIKGEEAPTELNQLNWIFLRATDDFNTAFVDLITAIRTDFEWVQIQRRLQVRALEWERGNRDTSFLLRGKDLQDAEAQLVANSGKSPKPTDLQTDYVLKSRHVTDRLRRSTLIIAISVSIAMAALAIFGLYQAKLATDRANIALARQLAAQAQSILTSRNSDPEIAVLLAVRSMKIFPTVEASQILQNNPIALPIVKTIWPARESTVAFSPDGKYIASGLDDSTVRIWDTQTLKEVIRLNDQRARTIALSPDNKYIATGSGSTANIWDISTGIIISSRTFGEHIESVTFSPKGNYVAAAGCDVYQYQPLCIQSTVYVWEAITGTEITQFTTYGKFNDIDSLDFSPDGNFVITNSHNYPALVWELATGKELTHKYHRNRIEIVGPINGYKAVVNGDNTIRVVESTTDTEIMQMTHDAVINSVAFSPNGEYLVSGSDDMTVRIWELATGNKVAGWTHGDSVNAVAFSSDGKYVVSGSDDRTARVWEISMDKEIARKTYDQWITSVSFSEGDRKIAIGSNDGKILFWDFIDEKEEYGLSDPFAIVNSVAFSSDDKQMVTIMGNNVHVWETSSGKEIVLMTHDDEVKSVALSPDGQFIVTGSADNTARVWDASTGIESFRILHDSSVNFVAYSPDGKYIVTVSGNIAYVWLASIGIEISHFTHEDFIASIAFSPDSKYIVSCGDTTTRVWEAVTAKEIKRIISSSEYSDAAFATFSPNGRYVFSINSVGRLWEVAPQEETTRITSDSSINTVDISPDSQYLIAGYEDGTIRMWDVATAELIRQMFDGANVNYVAFSPDGNYILSGSDSSARLWETTTGNEIFHNDGPVSSGAFSPDSKYYATMSGTFSDESTHIWDVTTGIELSHITNLRRGESIAISPNGKFIAMGGADYIKVSEISSNGKVITIAFSGGDQWVYSNAVVFSSDNKYVISGNNNGTIVVWNFARSKEVIRMKTYGSVSSVALSSDGKYLVAGSADGTVGIWEIATGREIKRMVHDNSVTSVAFSPNGKFVVSGSIDRSLRIWNIQSQDIIANACSRVTRNLTQAEWEQYMGNTPYQTICSELPNGP